ncbi:MAG: SRPBCC domain-containing protein [Dehalococcoidia bacterium]|nr:SRPBCC family protein [Dehalococcoidia bacterium]
MSSTTVSGFQDLAAPAAAAYPILLDPAQIKDAIPGCDEFCETAPERYTVRLSLNVIAFTATVSGEVTITDQVEPVSYRVLVTGTGSLGTLNIEAQMHLTDMPTGSRLTYDIDIEALGQLGMMAAPVLNPAAKIILGQFMERVAAQVAAAN